MWQRRAITAMLFAAICTGSEAAHAGEEKPLSQEQRDQATRAFEEGERAFRAKDFIRAAERFEEAYRTAPHPAPLWNAARSWAKAGEIARAANGYARYLKESPPDAPDRDEAGRALAELAKKLGRIEVFAKGAESVRIDDAPLEGTMLYVHPGTHVIEARIGEKTVRQTEVLEEGSVRSVALVEETTKTPEEPSPALEPAVKPKPIVLPQTIAGRTNRSPQKAPAKGAPERPAWLLPTILAGSALTLTSTGLVVWSGLDTLSAREDFDAAPSQDKLESGQDKQFRTNLLIGAAVGFGVVTGAAMSYLWLGAPRKSVAITPSLPIAGGALGLSASGSF